MGAVHHPARGLGKDNSLLDRQKQCRDLRQVGRMPRRRKSRNEQLCSRTNAALVITCPFWTPLMSVLDLHKHRPSRDGRCPRREMDAARKGRPAGAIRRS